jgi:isochorismate synthase EntC
LSRKGQQESNIIDEIMSIIREKLSGCPWLSEIPAEIDASSIAILSARLLLDLSPATAHAKRYEELVRNHLRMLYSVHENRQTIVTGSSPEPLIAEASAQIMNHPLANKGLYGVCWGNLSIMAWHRRALSES